MSFNSGQQTFEDYVLSVVGNCLIEGAKIPGSDLKGLALEVTQALLESRKLLTVFEPLGKD